MKKIILILFALLLISGQAWGATYYVNGSGAQYTGTQGVYGVGSDATADGTAIATPYATIQAAMTGAGAGAHTFYLAQFAYTAGVSVASAGAKTIASDGTVSITSASGATIDTGTNSQGISVNNISISSAAAGILVQVDIDTAVVTLNNCALVGNASNNAINHVNGDIIINNCVVSGTFANDFIISGAATDALDLITIDGLFGTLDVDGDSLIRLAGGATLDVQNLGTADSRFSFAGTPVFIIEAITVGKSASVKLKDWYITLDLNFTTAPIGFWNGAYTIEIDGLDIIATANYAPVATSNGIIRIADQLNPVLKNLNIVSHGVAQKTHVLFRSTGTSLGSPSITNSTFTTASEVGYCISFGDEASTDTREMMTPVFTGNTIRATAGAGTLHATIIYGNINGVIAVNKYYGAGVGTNYGLIVKGHTAQQEWSSGYVAQNLFKDLPISVYPKGMRAVPIRNNTIIDGGISIGANGAFDAQNTLLIQNIVQNATLKGIAVEATSAMGLTVSKNAMGTGGAVFATVGAATYANRGAWLVDYPNDLNIAPDTTAGVMNASSLLINQGGTASTMGLTETQTDPFGHTYFYAPYDRVNPGADHRYSDAALRPTAGGLLWRNAGR
jgi:hypothetical protein